MSAIGGLRPADVGGALRLLGALPGLLRRPVAPETARDALRRRRERRAEGFLTLVRRAVYARPGSPYHRLLAAAGCEYGDLARLVAADGVEGALERLLRAGVYLTVDEAKGRRPVVRGSTVFRVGPGALANPDTASHVVHATSGSRGPATVIAVDARHFRERAVNLVLCLAARGGRGWQHALWLVPGGAATTVLLLLAAVGAPPGAWFSQLDPTGPALGPRYRWTERLLRWASGAVGALLPRPRLAPLDDPAPVAAWLRRCRASGGTPHLWTFPTSAVALCRAAGDLAGVHMSIGGEPVTAARLGAIRAAGVSAVPHYGSMESGRIAEGCLAPAEPDDVHVFDDLHAVIHPGEPGGGGLPSRALLVSALHPTAPVVLLNGSLGDQAVLARRRCGCALEALGWTTHLHTIRSDATLTAAGMTLLDADVARVLEEVLPARCGGDATDYQLLEEEDADGRPRLVLLVAPRVGPVDPVRVAATLLDGLAMDAGRAAAALWRDAGVLAIERRSPLPGASGKVLHRHGRAGARLPVPERA